MPSLDATMRELLARPREAGTPAAEAARGIVTAHLTALGFRVDVQRFAFSPSALHGLPVFGAGLGGLALLLFPLLTSPRAPAYGACLVAAGGVAALLAAAVGIGLGWLPLGDVPREDANLIATRGGEPVRRWLVAHLDSKAQVQSMAGRLIAVWVMAAAVVALVGLALVRCRGAIPVSWAAAAAGLAVLAGLLGGRGRLRGGSRGARDNGTGVAAVLAAAAWLAEAPGEARVGLLVTGAEEFGLVGARVFAAAHAGRLRDAVIVNFDTIDDQGELALVCHDQAGAALARREAARVAPLGYGARVRRLPAGILTDSVPFARRGIPAITVGRLTWHTLRTIHTPRDGAEGLSLDAAIAAGRALAAN